MNNMDILENFYFYFKEKANDLIQQAYKERFMIPNVMCEELFEKKSYEDFYALIKAKKIYLNFKFGEVALSRKEYDVLLQLATGKTIKEVARKLGIAPKTTEQHLANAKNKSNYIFRSQLIDALRDNLLSTTASST